MSLSYINASNSFKDQTQRQNREEKNDLSDLARHLLAPGTIAAISDIADIDLLLFSHKVISKVYRGASEKEKISSEEQFLEDFLTW